MIHYHGKLTSLRADIPPDARTWRNAPEVFRWCRQYTLVDEYSHGAWLDKIVKDPSIKMFGIWGNGYPIGVCGLTSINQMNQTAEFSLYIAPDYLCCGFGTDALYTLLRHGFEDFNLNRIWGETFDENPAARIFTKMGMKHEGTLRQSYFRQGRFIDTHIYSILIGEFKP